MDLTSHPNCLIARRAPDRFLPISFEKERFGWLLDGTYFHLKWMPELSEPRYRFMYWFIRKGSILRRAGRISAYRGVSMNRRLAGLMRAEYEAFPG